MKNDPSAFRRRLSTGREAQRHRADTRGKAGNDFVGSNKDALAMREIGASAFIFASDQAVMRQAAARVLAEFEALV